MEWLVLIVGVLLAVAAAITLVAHVAVAVDAIPSATVRRWLVIPAALLALSAACLFAAFVYYTPDFRRDVGKAWTSTYGGLPTTTILVVAVVSSFALTLAAAAIYGFLPQRGEPYRPCAASWNLAKCRRTTVGLLAAAIAVLLVQDFELRWRLGHMETRALSLAESLTPRSVPNEDNAANYYQAIIDSSERLDELNNAYENDCTGLDLCACDSPRRAEYFDKLSVLLSGFQKAAECRVCRFDDKHAPVDLLDAMDVRYDLISAMQGLIRLAEYDACQQRPAESLERLRCIRHIEDHLALDPRGTEMVFYFWLEAWTCHAVEQLATYSDGLPLEEARSLMADPLDPATIYPSAVKWKAAVFQMTVVKTYDGRSYERPETRDQLIENPIGRALQLAIMRLLFARDDMRSMEVYFPFLKYPEDPDAWHSHDYMDIIPTGYILPAIESSSWAEGWTSRANSWRVLTNIALAAALYHQQHGHWPDVMEKLVPDYLPDVPTDPLSGKDYLWINIEDGLIVYSEEDAEAFQNFTDSNDSWMDLEHRMLYGSLFLGKAYVQRQSAGLIDPDDPCAGRRF